MEPFSAVLLAALGVLISAGANEAATRIARAGADAVKTRWKLLLYLWPVVTIAPIAVAIFIWSPVNANFPAREFYRVAAEVIPLLLLALIVEQRLVAALTPGLRIEFITVLISAEIAAFVGVAGIFATSDNPDDFMIGRTAGWTGVIATVTGSGLVAGALLVAAAVRIRAEPDKALPVS